MRKSIWILQIPIAGIFALLFWTFLMGESGHFRTPSPARWVYENLRNFQGAMTDLKFRIRGPVPPKNKIVIVAIDEASRSVHGPWPWNRDRQADLIQAVFRSGAKTVGLNYVNAEPEPRLNPDLEKILTENGFGPTLADFNGDRIFRNRAIVPFSDRLVLGHQAISLPEEPGFGVRPEERLRFSLPSVFKPENFQLSRARQPIATHVLENLPLHTTAARHLGLLNITGESDGVLRKADLVWHSSTGQLLPTLAMEMARVGLQEDFEVVFDDRHAVKIVRFKTSGRVIPTAPDGAMPINFRGGSFAFATLSAKDILAQNPDALTVPVRTLANISPSDASANPFSGLFKDAYVLIGVTGRAEDTQETPFGSKVSTVESHAHVLENLLSGDSLTPFSDSQSVIGVFVLLALGLALGVAHEKLSRGAGLGLLAGVLGLLVFGDVWILFPRGLNIPMSLVYSEYAVISFLSLTLKSVLEQRKRTFLKSIFRSTVAPAVAKSLVKTHTPAVALSHKKELSMLLGGIRNFGKFSETMDATLLGDFLNECHGRITEIVFRHSGTLERALKEGVVAFWNAPLSTEKHAFASLEAAIEIQKTFRTDHDRYLRQFGIDFQIGLGVHTGVVTVGNMGPKDRFHYTIVGDEVSLTSRLEALTRYYGVSILTTQNTLAAAKATLQKLPPHRAIDSVKVRARTRPVEVVQILETDMPAASLEAFAAARVHFEKRQWDKAKECFLGAERLLKLPRDQVDMPCRIFLERCDRFKRTPPPKAWDGSMAMTSR